MKAFLKPLLVGLIVAGAAWGTNVSYAQSATTSTLPELQAQLVELEAKIIDPVNTAYVVDIQAEIDGTKASIAALIALVKAPEQPVVLPVDHSINANAVVADPNWVPSFISTGNATQDAEIIHQYKVSKGLEKDQE